MWHSEGLSITESLNVRGTDQNNSYTNNVKYNATSVATEPTITLFRRFGPLGISAFGGFHVTLVSGEFRDMNNGNGLKLSSQSKAATMQLSGYRAGGSIGLFFNQRTTTEFDRFYLGPGMGLDYGGIGLNACFMTTQHLGMFVGVGYNLYKVGSNAGFRVYLNGPTAATRPYFSGMYGYNAVVIIRDKADYSRTFYGSSFGFGVDFTNGNNNAWTLALHIPVRSPEVGAYINNLKSMGVKFDRELLPISMSGGFRFASPH